MSKREYKVGYKKPPAHTRFRKGQSGNPSGGRKKKRTISDELEIVLAETTAVVEGGKRRRMTKERALLRRVVATGLAGQHKAMDFLLRYMLERDRPFSHDQAIPDEYIVAMALMNMSWEDQQL